MIGLIELPSVWAQTTTPGGTSASSWALLSLRRWYSSPTLSSPEAVPSLFALWSWLLGLAALLGLAMIFQGPSLAFRQWFDLSGYLRLASDSLARIRRTGRVVAVTIGMTVVAWTAGQIRTYNQAQGKVDLLLLTKSRSLGELAAEQGVMAALTPLRDVVGMGDNFLLLSLATILLFRATADRLGGPYVPIALARPRPSPWGLAGWIAGALYLLYRLVSLASETGDLPLGGMVVEVVVVPLLMLLVDATILSWVLVELRNASLGDTGNDALDTEQVVDLMPGTALACLAALPACYLATGFLLLSFYLPASTVLFRLVRWQVYWGRADVQAAALMTTGLVGVVAWNRGTLGGALRGYLRLLAAQGGRLAGVLTLAGLAAGTVSAVAYLVVLSLPAQTWVLTAADAYAHYATLPIGLFTLAALVELGERWLPEAVLASSDAFESNPA